MWIRVRGWSGLGVCGSGLVRVMDVWIGVRGWSGLGMCGSGLGVGHG